MTSTEVLASNGQGILLTWAVQNQIQVSFPQVYPTSPSNAAPRPQGHPKLHHSDNSGSYSQISNGISKCLIWYQVPASDYTFTTSQSIMWRSSRHLLDIYPIFARIRFSSLVHINFPNSYLAVWRKCRNVSAVLSLDKNSCMKPLVSLQSLTSCRLALLESFSLKLFKSSRDRIMFYRQLVAKPLAMNYETLYT